MMATIEMVTCTAPVNMALIKYWGKRNEELILPIASSLSITLDQNQMCAKTTAAWGSTFESDKFWLNGQEQDMSNARLRSVLNEIRKRSPIQNGYHVHICSSNNFPTAAGLASSAAGYACLVAALAKLYQVEGDLSQLARRGSGSACRSVYGGFVEWVRGEMDDGSDSLAHLVAPASHWPDLRVLVLVVNDKAKIIGSTDAMRNCVSTSDFLETWTRLVPKQISLIKTAILEKDFATLANLTMKASCQLHALCLETTPPTVYMNDISHSIVRLVQAFNTTHNDVLAAYTFDAGPNACIITRKEHVAELLSLFNFIFPPSPSADSYFRGLPVDHMLPPNQEIVNLASVDIKYGALRYIIQTQLGEGPQQVTDHLLSCDGLPL